MNIPEKYRDRYDNLARSHPWMREMRDEQAPEGDALEIMRTKRFGEACDELGIDRNGKGHCTEALRVLADMVERDYVSRETHIKAADIWQATCEEWEKRCRKLEAERDELKSRHCPHYHVDENYCDVHETQIKKLYEKIHELEAERDKWKRKAEQSERAMNAAAGKWARADAELREENDPETPVFVENPQKSPEKGREDAASADCGHSADMSQMSADCVRDGGEMSEKAARRERRAEGASLRHRIRKRREESRNSQAGRARRAAIRLRRDGAHRRRSVPGVRVQHGRRERRGGRMTRNFEDERERWEYDFGRRLNMLRENAGMRYGDLAKAAGIGTTMTWRYLTGASEPTAYVLRNLALALGTSADVLLGLDLEEELYGD